MKGQRLINIMILLLSATMSLRAWLYIQYFAIHGKTTIAQIALVVIIITCLYLLRTIYTATRSGELATSGLYKIVAHPAYVMYIIIDLPLWFLMPRDLFSTVTALLFYTVILCTAYVEEFFLIQKFGDKARRYYGKTPSVHLVIQKGSLLR